MSWDWYWNTRHVPNWLGPRGLCIKASSIHNWPNFLAVFICKGICLLLDKFTKGWSLFCYLPGEPTILEWPKDSLSSASTVLVIEFLTAWLWWQEGLWDFLSGGAVTFRSIFIFIWQRELKRWGRWIVVDFVVASKYCFLYQLAFKVVPLIGWPVTTRILCSKMYWAENESIVQIAL